MTKKLAEALLTSGKAEEFVVTHIRSNRHRIGRNFRSDWMLALALLPHFNKEDDSPPSFGVVAFKLMDMDHEGSALFCKHALVITEQGVQNNNGNKYYRVDQSTESDTWIVHC